MAKLNTKEYDRVYSLVNNTLNNTVKAALIKKYNKKVKEFIKNNPPVLKDDITLRAFDYYDTSNFVDISHIHEYYRELRKDFDAELSKYHTKRDKFMLKISLDDKSAIKELDKFLKELEEVSKNV